MNPDYAQRRRVAIAAAITVILVPAAFLLNRGSDDEAATPTVTFVGATVVADDRTPEAPATEPPRDDPMGTAPVAYLDGTSPAQDSDPATIAIPRPPDGITGTASFRRSITATTACQVKGVPFNTAVTVTNLDNSRSVRCIANVGGTEPDVDVVLNADAFLLIADLTDAPVPVTITW